MDDDQMDQSAAPPEVTISPADNGHVVRWHQRSGKRGEPGRSITRVASSKEEALGHADEALGGGGSTKSSKKRTTSTRSSVGRVTDDEAGEQSSAPAAHSPSPTTHSPHRNQSRGSARRRRARIGGRR